MYKFKRVKALRSQFTCCLRIYKVNNISCLRNHDGDTEKKACLKYFMPLVGFNDVPKTATANRI